LRLRRPGASREGGSVDWLVVGLGNPGTEYAHTRHNAGADVVALLAERHGGRLRLGKERSLVDEVRVGDQRVALAFPQTYMNDSGLAVGLLVRRFGIEKLPQVIVVHDELDLPLGRLKIKEGGGTAGHNGLRSVQAHLKGNDFLRVRIGVGKPPSKEHGADHVLRKPSKKDRTELEIMVVDAADAVEAIVTDGLAAAMNRFNTQA
jgi:PTH1 family peptidyl-tRNA hydrolase